MEPHNKHRTKKLSSLLVIEGKVDNYSLVDVKNEHEDQTEGFLLGNKTAIKAEPELDQFEIENFSSTNFICKDNKIKRNGYILDCSDINDLKGSKDFGFQQIQILKTESSETKIENKNLPVVVYDDWKFKNEEVDLKEEAACENEIKSKDFGSKKIEILQTEGCELKSEINKFPELDYDDWKIKNEEADVKEEDLLDNQINWPSGQYIQEKCDVSKKHNFCASDFQMKKNNLKGVLEHENPEGENLFSCDKCEYRTYVKRYFNSHLLIHKNPEEVDSFLCDKCEYRTCIKQYLKRHLLTHKNPEEVNLFQCNQCEFRTRYKSGLKVHALRHESPEEVILFRCDECEYRTRYKANYKKHVLLHKNPEEVDSFRCDKCEYQTPIKGHLKRHVLRHKNPEEVDLLKCDKCEYQTLYKTCLKVHALRHANPEEVDLFRCDKCEYQTCVKKYLKSHCLVHKNPREVDLFRCDKCEYRTCIKRYLNRHLLRHENPKGVDFFRCDKCLYRTRCKSVLNKHLWRKHGKALKK